MTEDQDQVTVGELSRNFISLRDHVDKRFDQVAVQLAGMKFVHADVYEANRAADKAELENVKSDVKEMQDRSTANWRAIMSDLVMPFILILAVALVLGKEYV